MKALAPARIAALEAAADRAARQPALARGQPRLAAHELTAQPLPPLGAGQPLPHELRAEMEPRFGHDFARVRVHADSHGAAATHALHAAAFTQGAHIAFAPGRWAPQQPQGRALLAHELAHVVQQSALAGGVPQCQDAAAPAIPTEGADNDLAGDADTAIRRQLVEAMNAFMNSVVGDAVFNEAMTQGTWDSEKAKEAQAQFDRTVAIAKDRLLGRNVKRPPVAITTTCIHVQGALLKRVKGLELLVGQHQVALGTAGKLITEPLGGGVWNEAAPNMARRPRRGDIYVLEFQDSKVTQLVQALTGALAEEPKVQAKAEAADAELAALKARVQAHEEGSAEPGDKKPAASEVLGRQALANQLHKQQTELNTRMTRLNQMLGTARTKAATTRGAQRAHIAKLNAKAAPDKQLADFEFSHVGYIVSITPLTDSDVRSGTGSRRERWLTFDGGQQVFRKGTMQEGATLIARIYHPETNEITGEATQGRGPRLLKGWIDVDRLQKQKAPAAEAAP